MLSFKGTRLIWAVLLLCASLSQWANAQESDDPQVALERLQEELQSRQATLAANRASAEELQQVLENSEREIGRVASQLNQTKSSLGENRERQAQLKKRQGELKQSISQQQSLLASQLRSAFMAGHYDYAKMIFNQEDARTFERVITYYQYVNEARQEQIVSFRNKVDELEAVNIELEQKATELVALVQQQESRQNELSARQKDREQTLKKLSVKIRTDESRIAQLREAEQALVEAIERAKRNTVEVADLTGLSNLKGKLPKPASGSFRKLFGKRRQGQVRWKGIIIEGREGSSISAIAPGRVLYADWLKGFGLVAILDHGDGFMSVYGHNQALLKQAGDLVGKGETIALLGQSGGQISPNLYFEIRHKGKALNPASWLDL